MLESAIPGQPGNSIIAGHRDTHFRFLKDVQQGDRILLESGGAFHRYTVKSIHITSPSDVSLLGQVPGSALTLVTCYPFYYLGPAPKRFIIRAEADPDNY
jgi:sortase A